MESPTDLAALSGLTVGNERVRALGSRHSFNDIADTEGVLIERSRLEIPLETDAAGRSAWVRFSNPYLERMLVG